MRILFADDHKLVREIVTSHLEVNGGFDVVQAEDCNAALREIDQSGPFEVILLDLAMPGMNGLNGLKHVVDINSPYATVVFSGNAQRQVVNDALALGARGFIPKSLPARSLINSINLVASGEIFLPANFFTNDIALEGDDAGFKDLASLERTILRELCAGATNKEIARDYELTEVSVKMHMRVICKKLGAKNRTHAAILAREAGIV